MNIPAFLTFIITTSFTPGPNNIMCMAKGTNEGLKKTLPFCFGVAVGFMMLLIASALFATMLYSVIPNIQTMLSYVGALYMLYLAFITIRDKPAKDKKHSFTPNGFFSAVLFQFINPKGLIFSLAVMASYVLPYYTEVLPIALSILVMSFTAFASTVTWATGGMALQKLFSKHKIVVNILLALALIYCAITLVLPH